MSNNDIMLHLVSRLEFPRRCCLLFVALTAYAKLAHIIIYAKFSRFVPGLAQLQAKQTWPLPFLITPYGATKKHE